MVVETLAEMVRSSSVIKGVELGRTEKLKFLEIIVKY
jgi:hypothetical protein